MKIVHMVMVVAIAFLAGCQYEAPLTTEHNIPVDASLLGNWALLPDQGVTPSTHERIIALRSSETEYLFHYLVGDSGVYFRGYAIKIDDVDCLQLQVLGSEEGPVGKKDKDLFQVVSYRISDNEVELRILNADLVSKDLRETESLRSAFLQHKEDKELFINPGRFRKVIEAAPPAAGGNKTPTPAE